ncbi:MAG: DUF5808 domain-containing protein [Holophagales bacterium]|jgi:hypothetical protein|nr:DUF5808 domain-containing protein [Holophagales bacterium]
MSKNIFARLFSPWDQLPFLAVIALVFMYMATVGEAPPLPFKAQPAGGRYMAPLNLWREAIVIGGFTWGLLWWMCASLAVFAKEEAIGAISLLEPIRGLTPTGEMAIFFGLLASIDRGRAWVVVGLGLFIASIVAAMVIAIRKLPYLSSMGHSSADSAAGGKWFGIFCYCREDSRILTPKKIGGGIAINLAHKRAWGLVVVGLALPLALAVIVSFCGVL